MVVLCNYFHPFFRFVFPLDMLKRGGFQGHFVVWTAYHEEVLFNLEQPSLSLSQLSFPGRSNHIHEPFPANISPVFLLYLILKKLGGFFLLAQLFLHNSSPKHLQTHTHRADGTDEDLLWIEQNATIIERKKVHFFFLKC